MKVLGLDVSTYLGMYLLGEDIEIGKVLHIEKAKGFSRLGAMRDSFVMMLNVWCPDFAVIEGYAFGNRNSLVTLVECGTVVRQVLHALKIPWMEVPPTALKKWTTGSGNADKKKMAAYVKDRWGFASHSDDIVDAHALARMGQLGVEGILQIKGVTRGV